MDIGVHAPELRWHAPHNGRMRRRVGAKMKSGMKLIAIVAVMVWAIPALAEPNVGLIEICRLPYEHHKELAKIPKGSTFIQSYPIKVIQPAAGNQPSKYVTDHAAGYVVKTLEDAAVAPAPACTTVRAAIVPQPRGAPLARDVPPLANGTTLLQQFEEPATIAQFKTQVVGGFK